jgi:transglutaminase-like putative cysteine protease
MRGEGVCRDLAHIGVALCRSISIPARLVVGYLYGLYPMDLHAWFEAYVGGRWYTFDPTQNQMKGGRTPYTINAVPSSGAGGHWFESSHPVYYFLMALFGSLHLANLGISYCPCISRPFKRFWLSTSLQ